MPMGASQMVKKPSAHGEFETTSAPTMDRRRTAPPAVSMRRKRASAPVTRSIGSMGSRLSRGSLSCCRPMRATTDEDLWDVVTPSDRGSAPMTNISGIAVVRILIAR